MSELEFLVDTVKGMGVLALIYGPLIGGYAIMSKIYPKIIYGVGWNGLESEVTTTGVEDGEQ